MQNVYCSMERRVFYLVRSSFSFLVLFLFMRLNMAQRSKLVRIPNVKTVVDAFEIRKERNGIAFGDVEDLKNVVDSGKGSASVHDQYRYFHDGNYSVSVLNYLEKKPVVLIHQENVDPCVMMEKTMQPSTATIVEPTKGSVFGPSEWLLSRRASSSGRRNQMRNPCLLWKSDGKVSDCVKRMKEIDLTGLLYFVCDFYFAQNPIQIAYSPDGVYKLTVNNTKIGFTVNLTAIFDGNSSGFTGILFEDPDSGCFALVVWSSDEAGTLQFDNKDKFILPMSSCLYDSIYRSFHNNGDDVYNPYYGLTPNGPSEFDFTRIPDHIFLQILRHLPLARRVRFRRVSQRWLSMANTALAVDTKIVDTNDRFHFHMTPDQLQSFLPLVSDCLENLTLNHRLVQSITLGTFSTITTFRALKELRFNVDFTGDNDALFLVLDKCPKLKVLTTLVINGFPVPYNTHGPYPVEKLKVWGERLMEGRLVAFLEFFPVVTHLIIITATGYISASCISWVLEKYGSKLQQFELSTGFSPFLQFGAVSGIQTCQNLQHLSLYDMTLISDALMGALAAGCHKLETLDFQFCTEVTNGGFGALAVLPNFTKLYITYGPDLSEGVAAIARKGRLIEFVAKYVILSAECLKTIVRRCRYLKLLEVDHNPDGLTVEDAVEIVRLYGICIMEPRLVFRSDDGIWESEDVREVIEDIKETRHKHFDVIGDD